MTNQEKIEVTDKQQKAWVRLMRSELDLALHKGAIQLTFTKKDGSERVMKCTLKDELVQIKPSKDESKNKRKVNEDVMPVWDLDKESWRSFRIDSIKNFERLYE